MTFTLSPGSAKIRLIYTLAAAALLSVPWLGVSGITLPVALVPLLALSESYPAGRSGFRRFMGWTTLAVSLWAGVTTWWIWYATWLGPVLSVIIMVVLFGGIFTAYHWVSKRVPRTIAYIFLISGWISLELLYTNGEVSFPWLTLGNGFANDIPFIQWYDTTGVFGGSLWVLVTNILFFEALRLKKRAPAIAAAVILIVPVAVSLVKYATYQESGSPVKFTAVQPDIDPYYEKFIIPQDKQTEILLELASRAPANADYVIFPETAIHDDIWENDIESNRTIKAFREFIDTNYPSTQFIVGASTRKFYGPGDEISKTARTASGGGRDFKYDYYNTVIALETGRPAELYHKSRLVVGVEKMPYYNIVKHLEFLIVDLGGTTGQLGVDDRRKVFTSGKGIRTGAAVCWEGVFGEYYGGFVREGAQVMAIISNDGWWEDTQGYRQLFRLSQLRAIETRRAIARSANTGISGFITQRGDAFDKVGWDIRATVSGEILTNEKITFYTRYGDYIARISVFVFILCILYIIAYRIKKRDHFAV
ncbi:MAG: apolipoprotein N-acyltransferase [Rikenellaceae bacterium]|nr:apolipoprotein N-acyltransferase [Rikenellaceae bacterium]